MGTDGKAGGMSEGQAEEMLELLRAQKDKGETTRNVLVALLVVVVLVVMLLFFLAQPRY